VDALFDSSPGCPGYCRHSASFVALIGGAGQGPMWMVCPSARLPSTIVSAQASKPVRVLSVSAEVTPGHPGRPAPICRRASP
jgi:hypothetical protein